MTITNSQLARVINHNADLLDEHINKSVYVHRQTDPQAVWKVKHSLGSRRPLIETYDSGENRIGHGVNRKTQTHDTCDIVFALPMAGTAIIRV
jgi:hypothetical protein